MTISIQRTESVARIRLSGRLTFERRKEFMAALREPVFDRVWKIELDFDEVNYLDSFGLGMLLVAKDLFVAKDKHLALVNCRGMVRETLGSSNFNKFFVIS